MTAPDPALVDLDRLGRWMDGHDLPPGELTHVEQLAGGTQNILVLLERGGRRYVLRRGPRHLRPRSNDVIAREARVLAAINDTDVPAPRLVAAETDPGNDVLGVVFYLMTPIDGFCPAGGLPEPFASSSELRHEMGLAAVDGIATLGSVDHVAVGLDDFGKPDGYLSRQVPRWLAELDSYGKLDGYPGPDIPPLERVAAWLEANVPTDWAPGIVHGDYHLANVLVRRDRPALAGILDWEMSTIGDPLVDLGWLVATFPGPDGLPVGPAMALNQVGGLPTPAELVARYRQRSQRDVSAIDWYTALACFRLGIILEGTHARACAGKADKGTGDVLHAITLALFDKADRLVAGIGQG